MDWKSRIEKYCFLLLVPSFIVLLLSNDSFPHDKKELSRMDAIISEAGRIIRFDDFNLPAIRGTYGMGKLEAKVRVLNTGETPYTYFLILARETKYSSARASIAEEELMELIEAFSSLIEMSLSESSTSDYAEIKYVGEEGLRIGYFKNVKGSKNWFVTLEKYTTGNTFLLKDPAELQKTFSLASQMIEDKSKK